MQVAAIALDGVPVEFVVRFGDPVREILDEADAFGADLVVPRRRAPPALLGTGPRRRAGVPSRRRARGAAARRPPRTGHPLTSAMGAGSRLVWGARAWGERGADAPRGRSCPTLRARPVAPAGGSVGEHGLFFGWGPALTLQNLACPTAREASRPHRRREAGHESASAVLASGCRSRHRIAGGVAASDRGRAAGAARSAHPGRGRSGARAACRAELKSLRAGIGAGPPAGEAAPPRVPGAGPSRRRPEARWARPRWSPTPSSPDSRSSSSPGEADDIVAQLPRDLKALWVRA